MPQYTETHTARYICTSLHTHSQQLLFPFSPHFPEFSQKLIKVSCILICFNFTLIITFHSICFIFFGSFDFSPSTHILLLLCSQCLGFKSYLPTFKILFSKTNLTHLFLANLLIYLLISDLKIINWHFSKA